MNERRAHNKADAGHSEPPASLPTPFEGEYQPDDAWSTIMQWLYHRMEVIHAETSDVLTLS